MTGENEQCRSLKGEVTSEAAGEGEQHLARQEEIGASGKGERAFAQTAVTPTSE